jgi:Subtilase family
MIERGRHAVLFVVALGSTGVRRKPLLVALAFAFALLCTSAAQASTVSPLPASNYTVQSACAAPAPGHAGCLAQLLIAETAAARAYTHPLGMTRSHAITAAKASEGAYGLRPQDLHSAYFPGEQPDAPASEPQMIALVDAYDDPNAEADLEVYDHEFSLPTCTEANGCFKKVNQEGETGHPPVASSEREQEEADGWALETSLDIEMAHAVCQNCHIVLVEADNAENANLEAAEDAAAEKIGATEISNSWGGEEPPADSAAFDHPGVVITVAAGDDGYLNWDASEEERENGVEIGGVDYPASSPHVVAVGGTSLTLSGPAETRSSETVWNNGGGGCSLGFMAQEWQRDVPDWSSVGCEERRAVADVAADADPYTGVAIYDSVPYVRPGGGLKNARVIGWTPIGGTSVASPIIASMFALAGGSHGVEYPAKTLYSHLGSASLYDVTEGGNGKCDDDYSSGCTGSMHPLSVSDCGQGVLICNAAPGYDGPSGVGAPNGIEAFKPARQLKGGGPEEPITEPCGEPIGAGGEQRVCGKLNPGASAKAGYYFAYNKGASCTGGKETELMPEVEGQAIVVSGELTGLQPATQYAYCLIATDPSGETSGSALTFTTEPVAPKAPETRSATNITSESATLEGKLRAEPVKTSWHFEYAAGESCTGAGAKTTPELQDTTLGEPDEVSAAIGALQPDAEYTACLVAKNSSGSTPGPEVTFKTLLPKPAVLGESASGETRTGVQLSGSVNPENGLAFYWFEYGPTSGYGSSTHEAQAGSGFGEVTVGPTTIGELKPGTTYHYRLLVSNGSGMSVGADETFTTLPATPPIVSTGTASDVSEHAATLSATIDPRGLPSTYEFELGTSTSYGIPVFGLAGQGTVAETIAVSVLFLEPGVTYHYRIQASNTEGTSYGADQTFMTPTYPALTFPPATTPPPKKTTKPKALTRAQKLTKALKACKRERNARKRAACMKRAKRKYGASKKKEGRKKT